MTNEERHKATIFKKMNTWQVWHILKVVYPQSVISIWKYFKSNSQMPVTFITIFIHNLSNSIFLKPWLYFWCTFHNNSIHQTWICMFNLTSLLLHSQRELCVRWKIFSYQYYMVVWIFRYATAVRYFLLCDKW